MILDLIIILPIYPHEIVEEVMDGEVQLRRSGMAKEDQLHGQLHLHHLLHRFLRRNPLHRILGLIPTSIVSTSMAVAPTVQVQQRLPVPNQLSNGRALYALSRTGRKLASVQCAAHPVVITNPLDIRCSPSPPTTYHEFEVVVVFSHNFQVHRINFQER